MHDRACPTCSGATDIPDGKGGIMPCPECQTGVEHWRVMAPLRDVLNRYDDARARLDCLWDDLN